MKTPAKALDIARQLIHLAAQEPEPDRLNPLRLQKLLYYVQGWSLALRSRPAFPDRIEAWVHGPVVPTVYRVFSEFGYDSIPPDNVPRPKLPPADVEFVTAVWNAYKGYSATSLRTMTHKEAPWLMARGVRKPGESCAEEISRESMKAFFSHLAKKK